MRVFVTGGTGHSGSYIIPELIAAGHENAHVTAPCVSDGEDRSRPPPAGRPSGLSSPTSRLEDVCVGMSAGLL